MPPHESKKNVRIWPVLRAYTKATTRYPRLLTGIIISIFGMQFASLAIPLYLKKLIDTLSSSAPSDTALHTLYMILVAYAVIGVINWISRRLQMQSINHIEANVMADLANDAFANLIGHSHDFFTSNFAGTLTRRVTRYSRSYEQVLDSFMLNFFPTLLFAIGSITVLFLRNQWLGLALLAWVVIFVIAQIIMTRWRHPLRVARAMEDSRLTGAISDVIGNQSATMLFAAELYERTNIGKVVESWRAATWRAWDSDSLMQGIQQALAIAIEVALIGIGIWLWKQHLLTVGDFILIQVYILGLIDQVWNIGNTLRRLYDAFADASEMLEIMETPQGIQNVPGAKDLAVTEGVIQFRDVSFMFNKTRSVLEHFDLSIESMEKVALVGPSGAGKTTITKLLLRFYDVGSGGIYIDDQNIAQVTQGSLRGAIALVPQEPVLFHRTLMENIRYGRRDASDAEVMEAAKQAHCHEFIDALPEKYGTYVGERGVKLSGGERQRVAIARAILKNAPILILDEATSSLDSESEALIQDALAKLMHGKTVIAIAHRLSTIMKMDRIIVMKEGKVELTGTHNELLAQESNLYKKLWEIQAGGFLKE